jgi:hypothetical protein
MSPLSKMGAEARPFFNWATDLSSIFKDRAERPRGATSRRGTST